MREFTTIEVGTADVLSSGIVAIDFKMVKAPAYDYGIDNEWLALKAFAHGAQVELFFRSFESAYAWLDAVRAELDRSQDAVVSAHLAELDAAEQQAADIAEQRLCAMCDTPDGSPHASGCPVSASELIAPIKSDDELMTTDCPGCRRPDCSNSGAHHAMCQCRLNVDDPRRNDRMAMCTSWINGDTVANSVIHGQRPA